ncbi:right-handed parallel beta-helix repeat-containing protein [Spongiactinospora sp. TRM90649]|uniref:right-handed parallel beta-helix repeat-containing protein n=1 Tax=Spongiactinospora sp. TRM90649 TaxID=3031114 RepID=UPI0023F775F1|nr:right-handed parallel beta-helix repeat-containing protein [Spongiactinospora sp. TRM90649]MDF5754010.1 right-handed parallel beta-helix repeat-containing protein [Spongiactinospora sp. TRM90649]
MPKTWISAATRRLLALASAVTLVVALAPRAEALTVNCGDTLTASVTLTADLHCPGPGFIIGADDVTVDLAGNSLTGSGTSTAIRVQGRTGVSVLNGTISGFGSGASVTNVGSVAGQIAFTDVRLVGQSVSGYPGGKVTLSGGLSTCEVKGVTILYGSVTIDDCTVTGPISIHSANYSAVRDSVLTGGSLTIAQSDLGVYTGNVFDGYPVTNGSECRRNLFKDNEFKNAPGTAFTAKEVFDPARATVVEDNVFRDNDIGLTGSGIRNVIVRDNMFEDNATVGMLLSNHHAMSSPAALSANVFTGNGHTPSGITDTSGAPIQGGIHLWTRTTNPIMRITLTDNIGTGNSGYMIWAPPAMVIDGGGNQGPCGPSPNPDLTCF